MQIINNVIRILFFILFIFLVLNGKMLLWLSLYVVSLFVALLFGRLYCGKICPMNTLMIPTGWLSKKLKLQKNTVPKWLKSGKFSWVALVGSIVIMILAQRLINRNIPILLIWLIISVLVTIRYNSVVFHNLICPFGPLQKFFGKFAIFSERVIKEGCIGCKKCEKVCPSDAIKVKLIDNKAEVNEALCLQCSNCQQVCPENTISYFKK